MQSLAAYECITENARDKRLYRESWIATRWIATCIVNGYVTNRKVKPLKHHQRVYLTIYLCIMFTRVRTYRVERVNVQKFIFYFILFCFILFFYFFIFCYFISFYFSFFFFLSFHYYSLRTNKPRANEITDLCVLCIFMYVCTCVRLYMQKKQTWYLSSRRI